MRLGYKGCVVCEYTRHDRRCVRLTSVIPASSWNSLIAAIVASIASFRMWKVNDLAFGSGSDEVGCGFNNLTRVLEGEVQEAPRESQVPEQEVLADEAQVVLAGENLGLHRAVMVRRGEKAVKLPPRERETQPRG